MQEDGVISKTVFCVSWVLLLLLTGGLIAVGTSAPAPLPKHVLIFGMMLVQAYLVSFYFMHLRFEKLPLILSVVLGILVTVCIFYAVVRWDGSHMVRLFLH